MAIIETKVDLLMELIDKHKSLSTKQAAKELEVDEPYVRRLAIVMQKNKLINIKASAFTMMLQAKQKLPS